MGMSLIVRGLACRTHFLPHPQKRLVFHWLLLHHSACATRAFDSQAVPQPQQLCQQLAAQFGARWAARVQEGPHGLGVFPLLDQGPEGSGPLGVHTTAAGSLCPLVELPACLAISNDKGSSSGPDVGLKLGVEQQHILEGPLKGCSWEIQIGFLLTWLVQQQPATHPAAAFWRQYSQLLPEYETQSCLLCWGEAELQQVKDDGLMQEVLGWQEEVRDAYARCCAAGAWGGPDCPPSTTCLQTGSSGVLPASSPAVPSLETFTWAVAAVQSRAFAFEEEGRELVALLPYFDLFNHSLHPTCEYAWDVQQQTYRLMLNTSGTAGSDGKLDSQPGMDGIESTAGNGGGSSSSASSDAETAATKRHRLAEWRGIEVSNHDLKELTISYGQKSNRKLMEQYGFVVPGNPHDRVDFQGLELPAAHGGRRLLSHSAVRAAAAALSQEIKQQQQQQQQGEVGGLSGGCGQGPCTPDMCRVQLVRIQCACASVLAAAGWRRKADYEAVTEDTTRQVAETLLQWVEQQQAALAVASGVTGSETLRPSTGAAGCSEASTDRLEAAAQYVCERAALLQATQQLLQQVLKL